MKRSLTMIGIAALLMLVSWVTLLPGIPKVYASLNLFVLVPTLYVDRVMSHDHFSYCGIVVAPLLFLLWSIPFRCIDERLPMRSLVLFVFAVALSVLYLATQSSLGVKYQGTGYVLGVWGFNLFCWLILGILAFLARRRAIHQFNLGFHAALFAWLSWCAFPYFGEL